MKKIKDNLNLIVVGIILLLLSAVYFKEKNNFLEDNKSNKVENIKINEQNIKKIAVHVDGEVNKPGVYYLDEGSRLIDLIELSGGFTEYANSSSMNLAIKLNDEMKIHVPKIGEDTEKNFEVKKSENKININIATKEELKSLPNIGENKAEQIVNYRKNNSFKKIEDLMLIPGFGQKTFNTLKDFITVN